MVFVDNFNSMAKNAKYALFRYLIMVILQFLLYMRQVAPQSNPYKVCQVWYICSAGTPPNLFFRTFAIHFMRRYHGPFFACFYFCYVVQICSTDLLFYKSEQWHLCDVLLVKWIISLNRSQTKMNRSNFSCTFSKYLTEEKH